VRDKVTIRHLLSHSSGLGSFFGPKFDEKKLGMREVRDYLPFIADEKLAFEPGSKFSYSNSGFVLLGAIVEKASGENYFDYVRKHVYAPAGMKDSDCYDVDSDVANLAVGYTQDDDGTWRSNIFLHVVRGGPAGGGYSTVGDLVRFATALRNDKLLKPETTREFTTRKSNVRGVNFAFGFLEETIRGHRIVGHSGGFPGINSNLDIFWNDGWIVAVMANVDLGAMPVQQKARELILSP
jgi:CubicO group peptidase (beta-lactamase class C family)